MQTSKAESHTLYYTGILPHAVHDRRQLTQSEKGWGADHMGHCQGVPCCLDSDLGGTACDQTCLYLWETNLFWAEQSCYADPEPSNRSFSFLIIVVLILRLHLCWATTALAFTAGSNRLSDVRMWCTGLLSAVMVGFHGQLLWSAWCAYFCSSSLVEQLT